MRIKIIFCAILSISLLSSCSSKESEEKSVENKDEKSEKKLVNQIEIKQVDVFDDRQIRAYGEPVFSVDPSETKLEIVESFQNYLEVDTNLHLIKESNISGDCPVSYRMIVSNNNGYILSESFGNCHKIEETKQKDSSLIFLMKDPSNELNHKYIFSSGIIRKDLTQENKIIRSKFIQADKIITSLKEDGGGIATDLMNAYSDHVKYLLSQYNVSFYDAYINFKSIMTSHIFKDFHFHFAGSFNEKHKESELFEQSESINDVFFYYDTGRFFSDSRGILLSKQGVVWKNLTGDVIKLGFNDIKTIRLVYEKGLSLTGWKIRINEIEGVDIRLSGLGDAKIIPFISSLIYLSNYLGADRSSQLELIIADQEKAILDGGLWDRHKGVVVGTSVAVAVGAATWMTGGAALLFLGALAEGTAGLGAVLTAAGGSSVGTGVIGGGAALASGAKASKFISGVASVGKAAPTIGKMVKSTNSAMATLKLANISTKLSKISLKNNRFARFAKNNTKNRSKTEVENRKNELNKLNSKENKKNGGLRNKQEHKKKWKEANKGKECSGPNGRGNIHHIIPIEAISKSLLSGSVLNKVFDNCPEIYFNDSEDYFNGARNNICIVPKKEKGRPKKDDPRTLGKHDCGGGHRPYNQAVIDSLERIPLDLPPDKTCKKISTIRDCYRAQTEMLGKKGCVNVLDKPIVSKGGRMSCPI